MAKRRVVVTGLGMLTPLGLNVTDTWAGVQAGKSGIGEIDIFDTTGYTTRIAGLIRNLDISDYMSPKEARKIDGFIQYGLVSAIQAITDSGLDKSGFKAERVGVAIGSGIGGIDTIEAGQATLMKRGPRRISPFFVPGSIINMCAGNLAIQYGFKGPNISIVTACTTGAHNIGYAARTIAYGDADVMIAGGAEKGATPLAMAAFCAARALSTRNDDPEGASRPWDQDRDGFVLSDGAGAVVLEELSHAEARGATIYAELTGFGMSDDAHHITAPTPDGSGAAASMTNALADAGIEPEEVQYVNAHGTSTLAGDVAESMAIRRAFGDHADRIAVSSTKSMTGHLLGAAGAIEAIFCVLALRDQVLPPTINLETPAEGCDLDYVPNQLRKADVQVAVSNSFGFGGTNGTMVFRRM